MRFKPKCAAAGSDAHQLGYFELLEAGLTTSNKNSPKAFQKLAAGQYPEALQSLTPPSDYSSAWLQSYLTGLVRVSSTLEKHDSEHFELWTPPGQSFLADYALPVLEENAKHLETIVRLSARPRRSASRNYPKNER